MRPTPICLLFLVGFILPACGPAVSINYLGSQHSPTEKIDIFFDEHDVRNNYFVIGHVSASETYEHSNLFDTTIDDTKNAMINRAKQKGGNAIVFLGYQNELVRQLPGPLDWSEESARQENLTVKKVLKAKVLKYR